MFEEYLKELSKVNLLTSEEEEKLWEEYKNKNNMEARAKLIESYQPLAFKIAIKMTPHESIIMDVIQEATIGLIEAIERYEPERGVSFPSYASFRIKGQVINFLQKINSEIISLDKSLDEEFQQPLLEQLRSEIYDEEQQIEKISWNEYLKEALKKLPEKERKVIELTLIQEMDMQKVAQQMKISLPHVYRLQKKGLLRMRGMLAKIRKRLR
jgi:RNA polymerase sporulation-specific sigma factor